MSADEENAEEKDIRRLFEKMKPEVMEYNVVIYKGDKESGDREGEIDLVCVFNDVAFIIEVSTNKQRKDRRVKRNDQLRKWKQVGRDGDIAKKMGWAQPKEMRLVYVDLSGRGNPELPMYDKDVLILYKNHVEQLERDSGEDARNRFLGWDSGK